jgi:ATP-dependent Clp protease protease subunit
MLFGKKVIDLSGYVGPNMAAYFEYILSTLPKNTKEAYVKINSGGGGVIEGFRIIDLMESSDITFHTVVHGMAASMAAIIALSADGKRIITKNSTLMLHQLSAFTFGKLSEINDDVGFYNKLQDRLSAVVKNSSNLDDDKIAQIMSRESYFDADAALELNLVDEIFKKDNIKAKTAQPQNGADMKFIFNKLKARLKNFKEDEVTQANADSFENEVDSVISNLESEVADLITKKAQQETEIADLKAQIKVFEDNQSDAATEAEKAEATERENVLANLVNDKIITPAKAKAYKDDEALKVLNSEQIKALHKGDKPKAETPTSAGDSPREYTAEEIAVAEAIGIELENKTTEA